MHRSRRSLVLGVLFCGLAILAIGVPGVGYARAANSDGIRLNEGTRQVNLPAHKTYGVYVNDADNSGYSESCSAVDSDGHQIEMRGPSWSASRSDTEVLDIVFDTGSGDVAINCSVPGEQVTVRPVPNLSALVVGILLGTVLGFIGFAMLLVWFFDRRSARRFAVPESITTSAS